MNGETKREKKNGERAEGNEGARERKNEKKKRTFDGIERGVNIVYR